MRLDPHAAYRTDPVFKRVVDTMQALLYDAQLTPSEMRAAATLACTLYEMHTVRPMIFPIAEQPRG